MITGKYLLVKVGLCYLSVCCSRTLSGGKTFKIMSMFFFFRHKWHVLWIGQRKKEKKNHIFSHKTSQENQYWDLPSIFHPPSREKPPVNWCTDPMTRKLLIWVVTSDFLSQKNCVCIAFVVAFSVCALEAFCFSITMKIMETRRLNV